MQRATATLRRLGRGTWPDTTILRGRGTHYAAHDPAGGASLKSVVSGTTTWSANGRSFVLSAGMHLLLGAGEYTVEIDTPGTETGTLCIFFEQGFLDDVASRFDEDIAAREWHECIESWEPRVWPLLQQLDQRGASEELLVAIGESVVGQHRGAASRIAGVRTSTREELYRRVLRGRDYLLSSIAEAVTMKDAAHAAALSPYHFHRAFRDAFGAPPHRYLAGKRLERAAHLLRTTKRPATEICAESGFESVPSFTNAFRRRYGRPPQAWRRIATVPS